MDLPLPAAQKIMLSFTSATALLPQFPIAVGSFLALIPASLVTRFPTSARVNDSGAFPLAIVPEEAEPLDDLRNISR